MKIVKDLTLWQYLIELLSFIETAVTESRQLNPNCVLSVRNIELIFPHCVSRCVAGLKYTRQE